ncbi:MAG TPA: glycosyltransferase family 4 protein [Gaiellaceae bacterium]|nr:glycosyltransferase family 4 protein [Gaiellaceae bacterium]
MEPGAEAIRVVAIFPEPTPYRSPALERIANLPEIDLSVVYAARTVGRRTWHVDLERNATFLRGFGIPGVRPLLRHDYPVTPGVVQLLERRRPDCVVLTGWSIFASQAAVLWCTARRVPYVLLTESHDHGPKPSWRRAVKESIVPRIVRGAAGYLVTGTLARRSMVSHGADPARIHVFANTVATERFAAETERLRPSRAALRAALGLDGDDVAVLTVARLAPEKGIDTLIEAVAAADDPRLALVVAGEGPERDTLSRLAAERGVRASFAGDVPWERIVEVYAACDVFALLSRHEPWGVVVNEAGACGLPLVLSDRVGAAYDLLRNGENGIRVPAGDVPAAAVALRELADDPSLRERMGAVSRELALGWSYEPSVDGFRAAVTGAVHGRD